MCSLRAAAAAEPGPESKAPSLSQDLPSSVFLSSPCSSASPGAAGLDSGLDNGLGCSDSPGGSPLSSPLSSPCPLSAILPAGPPSPSPTLPLPPTAGTQYETLEPLDPLLPPEDDLCSLGLGSLGLGLGLLLPGGWDVSQLDQLDLLLNSL